MITENSFTNKKATARVAYIISRTLCDHMSVTDIYVEELHCVVVEGGYSKVIKLAGRARLLFPLVALHVGSETNLFRAGIGAPG